ncbi:MAG: hypothetical protein K2M89_04590 [Clostridiales bacterium]|nr:hypothetical protein [Clostridiales bacterium]
MNLFDKIMIGNGEGTSLPQTRFKAFFRYGREYFGRLVLFGVITAAFLIPAIVWLFVMNYGSAVAIAALDKSSEAYMGQVAGIRLGGALTTYGVLVPLIMLFFVGLAGLFSAVKRISQGDICRVWDYFKGIRENGLRFLLLGAVFGLSLFCVSYNTVYLSTVEVTTGTAALYAVTVMQFVFCSIFSLWFMTNVTIYSVGLFQAIKNSAILTVYKLFKNLLMFAAVALPVALLLIIPSPFNILVMLVMAFLYFGFWALGVFSYANYVYDRTINKALGEQYVGRGLGTAHETDCATTTTEAAYDS